MTKFARRHIAIASTICSSLLLGGGCDPQQIVVTSVDTFCASVDRYHATAAQRAALKANPDLWESLVNWIGGIDKTWDDKCLKPPATSH